MDYLIFIATAITAICMIPSAIKMFFLDIKTEVIGTSGKHANLIVSVSSRHFPRLLRGFKSKELLIAEGSFSIRDFSLTPEFKSPPSAHFLPVLADIGAEPQRFFITVSHNAPIAASSLFIARYNPIASTISIRLCTITQN